MKQSLIDKLETLRERLEELTATLAAPESLADQARYRALAREYADLEPIIAGFRRYQEATDEVAAARTMLEDPDPAIRELAVEELRAARARLEALEPELAALLVPADPDDDANLFLEVRAGTGGDEAALFAGDLLRMYLRYAELHGWQHELVHSSAGEQGGYKEAVLRIAGPGAHARLKFESGGHRVQRVPETEAQGRIHTSACTVAVLPEADEITDVPIDAGDLRIDTFRASGAGGQHVNKTDSAIRITHLPSGMVVECQDERSQHKNRARAMSLLKARLLDAERAEQASERAATRRLLVGSGDRSQRIRTYNFPQGRVTDHRINLTLYKLADVLEGQLDLLIDRLREEEHADKLAALGA